MEHELKTISPYFEAVDRGEKTFEIRKDDRNFKVGDALILRHWDPFRECFTSLQWKQPIYVVVTYILRDERFLQPGYCCMSIE